MVADIWVSTDNPVQLHVSFLPETADIVSIAQDATDPLNVSINGSTAVVSHSGSNRYIIRAQSVTGNENDVSVTVRGPGGLQIYHLPGVMDETNAGSN
jgi:hypothetical protein